MRVNILNLKTLILWHIIWAFFGLFRLRFGKQILKILLVFSLLFLFILSLLFLFILSMLALRRLLLLRNNLRLLVKQLVLEARLFVWIVVYCLIILNCLSNFNFICQSTILRWLNFATKKCLIERTNTLLFLTICSSSFFGFRRKRRIQITFFVILLRFSFCFLVQMLLLVFHLLFNLVLLVFQFLFNLWLLNSISFNECLIFSCHSIRLFIHALIKVL